MGKKNKTAIIGIVALIVLAAAGLLVYRLFAGISVAEAYWHEEESRILYAKVTPENDRIKVEVTDHHVETEDSVPVLKTDTHTFTGSLDGEKLTLQPQSGASVDATVNATVNADELVFLGSLQEGGQVLPKLSASQASLYQKQLAALTSRVNEQAEVKKKELAEKRAKEEARVQFAKKVEKTDRLAADLVENADYLNDLQFAEEASLYREHVSEMQGLLEEVKLYAGQPGLQKTEFAVMQETVGAMKVLADGMQTIEAGINDKKKRMSDISGVLTTDLADAQATWEEIKAAAPKPAERQKAFDEATKTASEAVEQAKQRMAAVDGEKASASQQAAKLYADAVALLNQAKPK